MLPSGSRHVLTVSAGANTTWPLGAEDGADLNTEVTGHNFFTVAEFALGHFDPSPVRGDEHAGRGNRYDFADFALHGAKRPD